MGCDIHGTVEYKDGDAWKFAFSIEDRLGRSYDLFGLLFGVRNYVNFDPIAPFRGVPDDITLDTWAELDPEGIDPDYKFHSHSWITWQELNSIDPERVSSKRDERIHRYKKTAKGLEYEGKSMGLGRLSKEDTDQLKELNRLEFEDYVYTYDFVTVKDVFSLDQKVFRQMEDLTEKYGDENVRMVVGFDS